MEKVLLVSDNRSASLSLSSFIKESFGCSIRLAESAAHARTIIGADTAWELIVLHLPLSDESGFELAQFISENTPACCVAIVRAEQAEQMTERAESCGVVVVPRPFSRQSLYQLLRAVDSAVRRSWELYSETLRLEARINEIQTIDRAKFRLMQYREMTEDEAHSYIEQYAMKNRKKKAAAAAEIIEKIEEQYM
ncbi:MAG: ANTAR domain-containing protein [Ruminococcus sp.]|nr:ANTAR domain-containing protein [Ruminococcus sp.]